MNEKLVSAPIGPEGKYGSVDLELVNGKLVAQIQISPAAMIDALAAKVGGPVPAEVAGWLEKAIGLS